MAADKETKSVEYTLTLKINRDNIPALYYAEARNELEKWLWEGLRGLGDQFTWDPALETAEEDSDGNSPWITESYISKIALEQTRGDY